MEMQEGAQNTMTTSQQNGNEMATRRYIFIKDNGKVAFTTDFAIGSLVRAAMRNATHVQDRETGKTHDVLHTGPLTDRIRWA